MKKTFLLIFLLISFHFFCKKNIPPEPEIYPPIEKKEKASFLVPESALNKFINDFIEEIKIKAYEKNISNIDKYFLFLNETKKEEEYLNYFHFFVRKEIQKFFPIINKEKIKNIIKDNKQIIILELSEDFLDNMYYLILRAYYPLIKDYVFSLRISIKEDKKIDNYLKANFSKEIYEEEIYEDYLLNTINDEIVDINIKDINYDNKKDIILFGTENIYIWLLAYNQIIDNKKIAFPEEIKIKSKEPSGAILNYKDKYLYLISTFLSKSICMDLEKEYSLLECPQEALEEYAAFNPYSGKNYFALNSSENKIKELHYFNILDDNPIFPSHYIGITHNNSIVLFRKDFSIVYESPFNTGKAITLKDNLMMVSSEKFDCPPDKVIVYKWLGNKFNEIAEKDFSSSCISALAIYEIKKNYLQYIYSDFDFFNKKSNIYIGFLRYFNENY